jgi:hypothetical protein
VAIQLKVRCAQFIHWIASRSLATTSLGAARGARFFSNRSQLAEALIKNRSSLLFHIKNKTVVLQLKTVRARDRALASFDFLVEKLYDLASV